VIGIVSQGEDSAMNLGMKRFEPAIHHFRKAGDIGNVFHRNFVFAQ
jgi:hypothetical protein